MWEISVKCGSSGNQMKMRKSPAQLGWNYPVNYLKTLLFEISGKRAMAIGFQNRRISLLEDY